MIGAVALGRITILHLFGPHKEFVHALLHPLLLSGHSGDAADL